MGSLTPKQMQKCFCLATDAVLEMTRTVIDAIGYVMGLNDTVGQLKLRINGIWDNGLN